MPPSAPPFAALAHAEVRPAWPTRLPGIGAEGLGQRDTTWVERVIHLGPAPVLLRAEQPEPELVVLRAWADEAADAAAGLVRLRFWSGVDDDLAGFHERFAGDALIGASLQTRPGLRPYRRPMPFEVLLGAICEQLVTDERAQAIRRAVVRALGRRDARTGLLDAPAAEVLAGVSPAHLLRCDLAAARATALIRVAREVATGRVDLLTDDPDRRTAGWRRLRAIPGIGPWTLSVLALHGQGHLDALPAGDHAYRMLVGERLAGRPGVKASEQDVVDFFAPYAGWRGLAGWHLLIPLRR